MSKIVLIAIAIMASACFSLHANEVSTSAMALQKEKIFLTVPPIANQDYFRVEFGFATPKKIQKWNYPFNAFAKVFIAEESGTTLPSLRAGAFGFGGGVFLPTQHWIPLFLEIGAGFAKTALHEDPWFGVREKSVSTRDQLFAEGGVVIRVGQKILLRTTYQVGTVKYFTKDIFFSLGANF